MYCARARKTFNTWLCSAARESIHSLRLPAVPSLQDSNVLLKHFDSEGPFLALLLSLCSWSIPLGVAWGGALQSIGYSLLLFVQPGAGFLNRKAENIGFGQHTCAQSGARNSFSLLPFLDPEQYGVRGVLENLAQSAEPTREQSARLTLCKHPAKAFLGERS